MAEFQAGAERGERRWSWNEPPEEGFGTGYNIRDKKLKRCIFYPPIEEIQSSC